MSGRSWWAAYQAQGLAIGDWRAQVTFDDPNPLRSGTDRVNDHDVVGTRWHAAELGRNGEVACVARLGALPYGSGMADPQSSTGGQGDLPATIAGEELRTSHADRDQVVELLRVAAGDGRSSRKNWTTGWNAR